MSNYILLNRIDAQIERFQEKFSLTEVEEGEFDLLLQRRIKVAGLVEQEDDDDFVEIFTPASPPTPSLKRSRPSQDEAAVYGHGGFFCFCLKQNGKPRKAKHRLHNHLDFQSKQYYVCQIKCCILDLLKITTLAVLVMEKNNLKTI
jgi:hypothetical protein